MPSSCWSNHPQVREVHGFPHPSPSNYLQKCLNRLPRDHPPHTCRIDPIHGEPKHSHSNAIALRLPLRDSNVPQNFHAKPTKTQLSSPVKHCHSRLFRHSKPPEMVTTIQRRANEAEIRALCNSHPVSSVSPSFLHQKSPVKSTDVPNLRASSLVQMWREFEAEAGKASRKTTRSNSFNSTFSPRTSTPHSDGWSSLDEPSEVLDSSDERLRDWESDQTDVSPPRASVEVCESERGKVADMIKQFTSVSQVHDDFTSWIDDFAMLEQTPFPSFHSRSFRNPSFSNRCMESRGNHVVSRLVIGWQDLTQFLAQNAIDRRKELDRLHDRHLVSGFSNRCRIQTLIKFRLLRNEVASPVVSTSSCSVNQDRLKRGSSIMLIRERFNHKSQEQNAIFQNSGSFNVRSHSCTNNSETPKYSCLSEDLYVGNVSHKEDVTTAEQAEDQAALSSADTAVSASEINAEYLEEGDMAMEEVGSNSSQAVSYIHDTSRASLLHEKVSDDVIRWNMHDDLQENASNSVELQELLQRKPVSSALNTDFKVRLNGLILSHLERQKHHDLDATNDDYREDWTHSSHGMVNNDLVTWTLSQLRYYPSGDDAQQGSQCTPHLSSVEMELMYNLREDVMHLLHEVSDLKQAVQNCTNMQMELQRTVKQEGSDFKEIAGISEKNSAKWQAARKKCCVCYERQVDCLLYRCGHLCTCVQCAHDLQCTSGRCPICRAPVADVVRAFLDT